jgi:hypothetical protein
VWPVELPLMWGFAHLVDLSGAGFRHPGPQKGQGDGKCYKVVLVLENPDDDVR